jgi:aspartyl-tRNA synthetase
MTNTSSVSTQEPPAEAWRRSHTCGELRGQDVGTEVVLNGWVANRRDHGGIYFVDLRDRYGLTQIVLRENIADAVKIGPEDVLSVRGEVVAREESNVNAERSTGEIEVVATALEILSKAKTPPFEVIDDLDTAVETRLRYRYIDLRRFPMLHRLEHRSRFINAMRRGFERQFFVEVETPILTKATPEGARDYLVPSRVHPGNFYALPQSPQIFKQILMVSGVDRYYQVARCFRDEDLRADRQPEFTQLDMEMSFVIEEDVYEAWETVLGEVFRETMNVDLSLPFPRITYDEAMERYGSDKPDLRYGLELKDAGEWAATSEFQVFKGAVEGGGRVMGICVPKAMGEFSRKDVTALEDIAKTFGAKGLAWWKAGADGGAGPLARFAGDAGRAADLMARMEAGEGDLCLFVADRESVTRRVLGELRSHLGKKLELGDPAEWAFTWVTEFPMFELDEETNTWSSSHHPFTAPQDWDLGGADPDLGALRSRAYDLVLNGWELGSGSIRIHRSDVQERIFKILGIGPEEQQVKFGFLLEALSYGAPPHGGFAMGLDRVVALTLGLDNLRGVIAFPKTTSASDLMCEAPSPVSEQQTSDVHIRTVVPAPRPSEDGRQTP